MNISDFIFSNNNIKIKDLISINKFNNEDDLSRLENYPLSVTLADGTNMELFKTKDKFIEDNKNLNIDVNKIYYNPKAQTFSNAVIYLDIEKFILLDLTNYLTFPSIHNIEQVSKTIKSLEMSFKDKDYSTLLFVLPDTFKIEIINLILHSVDTITDELYSTIMDYYTTTDFGFSSLSYNSLNRLFNSKSENLKQETKDKLSSLPEKVLVYRGEADKSTPYSKAYSWTLLPNIATFFSLRLTKHKGRIVSGYINKDDIIEYFDNDEQEILILPDKVDVLDICDFYTMNEMSPVMDDVMSVYSDHKYILNNYLNFEHDDREHGKLHSLRVLLNALVLGSLKDLNVIDLHLLATASIYHDIGRTNNDIDDSHGKRSKEIFKKESRLYSELLGFLIEYHCIEDDIALEALEESNIDDKGHAKELFFILKDADALDRFRFGLRDLDFTRLRFEESKKMQLFSYLATKFITL